MNFFKSFRARLARWADWFALLAVAFAAPVIALFAHSLYVFYSGFRLYNAEIGGVYFRPGADGRGSWSFYHFLSVCSVLAIPTFLVLLPFRKLTLTRWMVWAGFIILWLFMAFQAEVAYR